MHDGRSFRLDPGIDRGDRDPSTASDLAVPTGATGATGSAVTTSEPEIEIPEGVLVVVPTQNREDPAKQQFQLQFVNGTRERFEVAGVQFRWSGFTTPFSPRDSIIAGGQTIDFPVPFPGATCVGDGTIDEMPDPTAATVELTLQDRSVRDAAVVDKWHLVRKLYLEDCVRQHIGREVRSSGSASTARSSRLAP